MPAPHPAVRTPDPRHLPQRAIARHAGPRAVVLQPRSTPPSTSSRLAGQGPAAASGGGGSGVAHNGMGARGLSSVHPHGMPTRGVPGNRPGSAGSRGAQHPSGPPASNPAAASTARRLASACPAPRNCSRTRQPAAPDTSDQRAGSERPRPRRGLLSLVRRLHPADPRPAPDWSPSLGHARTDTTRSDPVADHDDGGAGGTKPGVLGRCELVERCEHDYAASDVVTGSVLRPRSEVVIESRS